MCARARKRDIGNEISSCRQTKALLLKHDIIICHFSFADMQEDGENVTATDLLSQRNSQRMSGLDKTEKATLKIHLPIGGFRNIKYGDSTEVKVRAFFLPFSFAHMQENCFRFT